MIKKDDHKAIIFNIPVFGKDEVTLLKMIEKRLLNGKNEDVLTIFTPNAEQIVMSLHNTSFRRALQTATVCIPDGMSLVLASRLLHLEDDSKFAIDHRIAGVDLIDDLMKLAHMANKRVFLLGGKETALQKTVEMFHARYPRVTITFDPGAVDIQRETALEKKRTLQKIQKSKADILLVAYGAPWQEMWVMSHKEILQEMGVKVVMVVGGAFDMLSGGIARAPKWMQVSGLEWLWRLVQEPWRWKRQLVLFEFWWLLGRYLLLGK